MNDPVADAARGILDGHVVLSRRLAAAGHFPTIDVLESVSRLASKVTSKPRLALAARLRRLMAAAAEAKDLVEIGAYVAGSDPVVDEALARRELIEAVPAPARRRGRRRRPLLGAARGDPRVSRRSRLATVVRVADLRESIARGELAAAGAASTRARAGRAGPPRRAGRLRPRRRRPARLGRPAGLARRRRRRRRRRGRTGPGQPGPRPPPRSPRPPGGPACSPPSSDRLRAEDEVRRLQADQRAADDSTVARHVRGGAA